MKIYFLILFFVFSSLNLVSQNHEICGYQTELNRMSKRNPQFLKFHNAWYNQALQEIHDLSQAKRTIIADTLYFEIPVVFHVLYNNTAQNTADALILNQINELNRAFRKLTEDTSRIRPIFKQIAADVRIQFVLATKDPSGNPTSGITRTFTNKTTFGTSQGAYTTDMKYDARGGKTAWDPTSYMNVWICNMQYPNLGSMVLGFATPPNGSPNWQQFPGSTKDTNDLESGVVLHYRIVGRNNPNPYLKYTEGKTAVHEVGHYLGLRHVWGDGNYTVGCSFDDGIDDTPNARLASTSCSGLNTCTDPVNDKPDQTENYMDYALDGCAGMFTEKQAYVMRFVLDKLRSGLPVRHIEYDTIPEPAGPETDMAWSVYPNPAKAESEVNVQIKGQTGAVYSAFIYDANGKFVSVFYLNNGNNKLNLSGLARSVYTFVLRDKEGLIIGRQKLVIW